MSRRYTDDDELKQLIYPLRVNSTISQLLLLKLLDINEAYSKAQKEMEEQRPRHSERVLIRELPAQDAAELLELKGLRDRAQELEKKLRDRYQTHMIFEVPGGEGLLTVDVSLTEEEQRRRNGEYQEKWNAMKQGFDARYSNLRDMARKMVDAHIKQIKSKIPQDLVDELQQV